MSALKWLSAFLEKRNLPEGKPDGRPLFAYRCTIEEFEELKSLLIEAEKNIPGSNFHLGYASSTGHLFALYCAEWWRRYYSGGVWKWAPIIDSLGWDHNTWGTRTDFVVEGLRYWKRDLIHTGAGTQYLLSVACEGGIPINVLEREGASFKHYLKAIVHDYGRYASSGLEAERIARDNLYRLPLSWQQDQIAVLAGQIVGKIWLLKSEIGESKNPAESLNETHPGWGAEFPIELESEQAETLINSLLTAAREVSSGANYLLRLDRSLDRRSDEWSLTARLLLPKEIDRSQIVATCSDVPIDTIPERLEMYRAIGDKQVLVAKLSGDGERWFVRPVSGATQSYTENVEKEVSVILVGRGRTVSPLAVAGGAELDPDLPWCFVKSDEDMNHFRWVGQGGCQRRESDVFVLSSERPVSLEGCGSSGVEKVEEHLLGRKFWWVTKPAELLSDQDDEIYRIEPGLERIAERDYRINGQRRYSPQTRFSLYRAVPNIQLVSEDSAHQVHCDELFWRPIGTRQWRTYNKKEMIGDIELRHRQNKVAFASWKLSVIPGDTKIRVEPNSRLEGSIYITIPNVRVATIDSTGSLDICAEQFGNTWKFVCKRRDASEMSVSGEIVWKNGQKMLFSLPYPAEGASFIDGDSKEIANSGLLTLDRLYGIKAQVVILNNTKRYLLKGSLTAKHGTLPAIKFHKFNVPIVVDEHGIGALPLQQLISNIGLLFAVSTGVDDQVKLELFDLLGQQAEASVMIQQFEGVLYIDQTRRMVSLATNDAELNDEYAGLPLKLVSINGIEEEPALLDWNEVGLGWILPDYDDETISVSHTYFATVSGEKSQLIRPCIVPPESNCEEELSQLSQAMTMSDVDDRQDYISRHLYSLNEEGSEEDWRELCAFLNRLSDVHPDGLDLVECMLDFPEIFASLWFRSVSDQVLRDYLQQICDTSPFTWWMINIDQWLSAAKKWLESMSDLPEPVQTILVEECTKRLTNLSDDNEEMNTAVEALLESFGESLPEGSVLLDIRASSVEWRKLDVMCRGFFIPTRGDDEEWPKIGDVYALQKKLPENIYHYIEWPVEEMYHQKPVIQAPIIAAAALHANIEMDENVRVAMLAARNFHPTAFATLFRAAQAILWLNQDNE